MIDIEKLYAMLDYVEGAAYDENYGVIAITARGITNYFDSDLNCIDCRTHSENIQKVYMLDETAKTDLADFIEENNDD